MRFERLVIEGFGALSGETVEFAPGMTVIFGPNESAKTTLHAATYAALCGIRRSRGQPRIEDRQFADRHRPWGGQPWRVQIQIRLEDGRVIELWHDLDGRVDCRAMDLSLGRDVSNEIMFEGSPDGSRWLGFDRSSFIATACVRQSAIAAVLENAEALQEELQRAAASAGRDETAAAAIDRLKLFSTNNVGLDRANSTRPLRRAIDGVNRAQEKYEQARQRHEDYLDALVRVDEREAARDERRRKLQLAEAVTMRATAARTQSVADRAAELANKHPQEPQGSAGYGQRGDAVAEALALWDGCPAEADLSGEAVDVLEAQLGQLPDRPVGDLSPTQDVLDAEAALRASVEVLEQNRRQKPAIVAEAPLPLESEELERLVASLEAHIPQVDAELRDRVAALRARVGNPDRPLPRLPLGLAVVFFVGGIITAIAVSPAVGVALIAIGAVVAGMTLWLGRQRPDPAADDALETAERMLSEQQFAADTASARRLAANEQLHTLGLPAEPHAIRALVASAQAAINAAGAFGAWEAEHARHAAVRESREEELRAALLGRQAEVGDDLLASAGEYKVACVARDRQEREANQRPGLEQRLAARRAAEADALARATARGRLLAVADEAGVAADEVTAAAAGLRDWQRRKQEELTEHDLATAEWTELHQLLGDRTIDELKVVAADSQAEADALATRFADDELAVLDPGVAAQSIAGIRDELARLDDEASSIRGSVEQMATDLPSVSEAEERLAAAQVELARVQALRDALNHTIAFLEAAQERVHRTIAPILQGTLREWLPRVVVSRNGETLIERYDDVVVDPESLRVQVRRDGGPLRDAALLSEGTKEQIFLLLRVALAEHLTKQGERAPLILDEITAQCDSDRRVALLDLIHELSGGRQVILFTHDEAALAWAQERLDLNSGTDRLEIREPLELGGS